MKIVHTAVLNAGGKGEEVTSNTRTEEYIELDENLLSMIKASGDEPEAKVTVSISTKVSDAVYYGSGTWDKVPFSVEVFSGATLACGQTPEKMKMAEEVARDFAWKSARGNIGKALAAHTDNMQKNLFKGYFDA